MEVWQVLVTLFCSAGCFVLGRMCGYDDAFTDVSEIINRITGLAKDGKFVEIRKGGNADEDQTDRGDGDLGE